VAQYPHDLGIGIDENTALVVRGAVCEVIGAGAVTIIDAGASSHSNVMTIKAHEALALCGVRLHVLPAPYRFDLKHRRPLLDPLQR
jgi:cyanophycinase